MGSWSTGEARYLRDHAHEGAEAVAGALGRSVSSVQVMASRMGVSLRRRWRCPRCGRVTYSPLTEWSGWCRACSVAESKQRAIAANSEVRRELAEEQKRVRRLERERQAVYSDTNKKRRKLKEIKNDEK